MGRNLLKTMVGNKSRGQFIKSRTIQPPTRSFWMTSPIATLTNMQAKWILWATFALHGVLNQGKWGAWWSEMEKWQKCFSYKFSWRLHPRFRRTVRRWATPSPLQERTLRHRSTKKDHKRDPTLDRHPGCTSPSPYDSWVDLSRSLSNLTEMNGPPYWSVGPWDVCADGSTQHVK